MKELIKGKKLSKQYYADTRRDAYDVMNSQIVYSEKEVDCVFIGDSITEYFELSHYFGEVGNIINRGIGGDVVYGVFSRFDVDVIQLDPKICVIMVGINELWDKIDSFARKNSDIIELYKEIEGYINDLIPMYEHMIQRAMAVGIRVLLCSVLPVIHELGKEFVFNEDHRNYYIQHLNERLVKLSKKCGCGYVDYHSAMKDNRGQLKQIYTWDGLHPHGKGYEVMAEILKPYLLSALKS